MSKSTIQRKATASVFTAKELAAAKKRAEGPVTLTLTSYKEDRAFFEEQAGIWRTEFFRASKAVRAIRAGQVHWFKIDGSNYGLFDVTNPDGGSIIAELPACTIVNHLESWADEWEEDFRAFGGDETHMVGVVRRLLRERDRLRKASN